MQEIVSIDTERRSIDHYRRDGQQWVLLAPEEVLHPNSVGVMIPRADVFADTDMPQPIL